ncbi:MAG: hypothetical protein SNH63_05305 [Rikenellaceae bacterium]
MKKLLITLALVLVGLVSVVAQQSDKVQKIYKGVEMLSLEEYTFKGMTSFLISAKLRNNDAVEYAMEGGRLVLMLAQDTVAVMRQNDVVRLAAKADGQQTTAMLWNIEKIEPMALMMLTVQLSQKNYAGMNLSYDVTFCEGDKKRQFSGKKIDLEKFLTTFAPSVM